jgi:hypothetical protein
MPTKKPRSKYRSSELSGLAATLFPLREEMAPLDASKFQKRAGEVIAAATQTAKAPIKKRSPRNEAK